MSTEEGNGNVPLSRVEQRYCEVSRLYLLGWPQHKIGQKCGVTQQQISLDLKVIRAQWLESAMQDFDAAKAKELAKLDLVESEFMDSWLKSKEQPRQTTSTKRKTGSNPSDEAAFRNEQSFGDPRYLDGALKCISKRCDILGLNAPAKHHVSLPGETDYGPFLTHDERKSRLLALFLAQGTAEEAGPSIN
jgi:hypothetical protein